MKNGILWISSLAFALLFSQSVIAMHQDSNCHCRGPMMKMMMIENKLNLTQEQKDKLKSFRVQNQAQLQGSREKMKTLRNEMHELVKSDKIDEAKLDSLIAQKKELMGELMKNKVMMHHQLYSILNDSQKQQLEAMRNNMQSKCPCGMMQKGGMMEQKGGMMIQNGGMMKQMAPANNNQ